MRQTQILNTQISKNPPVSKPKPPAGYPASFRPQRSVCSFLTFKQSSAILFPKSGTTHGLAHCQVLPPAFGSSSQSEFQESRLEIITGAEEAAAFLGNLLTVLAEEPTQAQRLELCAGGRVYRGSFTKITMLLGFGEAMGGSPLEKGKPHHN